MAKHLGYLIGLITLLVMTGDAVTAGLRDATRAEDVAAYATLAGIAAGAAVVWRRWRPDHAQYLFLPSAFIAMLAGIRGLDQFWGYALGFAAAAIAAVVMPLRGGTQTQFRSRER